MKKSSIILFFLVAFLAIATNSLHAKSATVIDNEPCGEDTYATLDENGVLTISGSGTTWDFLPEYDPSATNYGIEPWAEHRDKITAVVITGDVREIGKFAFRECPNLKSVTFKPALESINGWAFGNCLVWIPSTGPQVSNP